MKRAICILTIFLAASLLARADDETISLPDLIQGAQQWAQENLDTNVLNALPQVDEQMAQQFFHDLQRQFQGDYVVNLAALRQAAQTVLPLLQSHEETQPYAAWLKAQMDYLEVADEIRITIPPPKIETNQPPPLPVNPPAQTEREIWIKKVAIEPWPDGAKKYVPQLKPVFAAQKVPPELVWLAEVESSFDRSVQSPAGAAGLFQLMPETAKRFGLSLWPRDQRFQAEPSASASARYLKFLHDKFGDWRLALAAYNCGEGTVQKLLNRYQTRNYDDIATHLPAETQMYVPRVEAVLRQREGAKLEELSVPQN
ncbi:MAG TPA: lytic transglycosylase domain-containing protein [Verrucomicrobiae bacterium]|nr:lytic transglycosylase domain-containing protein [Verrucomicrobiae bacterium]